MNPRFTLPLAGLLTLLAGQALFAQAPSTNSKRPIEARQSKPGDPAAKLAGADAAYGRKSYAAALRGYREAVRSKSLPAGRRPQVEYRIARCLGLTGQWDAAIAEGQRFTARHAGTAWEARGRHWMMELYLMLPAAGWKVGDRYFRGRSVPEVEVAVAPEQVDLAADDQRKAIAFGEQAKALWEKLRGKDTSEEADLAADLAAAVTALQLAEWARGRVWKSPDHPDWKLDGALAYDPAWAPPRKVVQLLLAAEALGSAAQKPLARLAQALWVKGYHAIMASTAWRTDDKGESVRIPYPYESRTALSVLRSLIRDYPSHPEAEHARLTEGEWLASDGKYSQALGVWRTLIQERPNGKWAESARAAVAGTIRRRLSLDGWAPQPPGKKASLSVHARNLEKIRFSAWRVRLEELVRDPRVLARPREGITDLFARLSRMKGIRQFYRGDPVRWEAVPKPDDPHAPWDESVETPLTRNGAYVVEAEAGPVRAAAFIMVSDLAALQIVDTAKAHTMVVNSATGAPVIEASALIREVYSDRQGMARVSSSTIATSKDGLAEKPLAASRSYSQNVLTFAWKGDRYAFTGGGWAQPASDAMPAATAYIYTERPVYRPEQAVHYRALLAARAKDGDWAPIAGQAVHIKVSDPRGAEIHRQRLTSGPFGSVNGKLDLPTGASLGEYNLAVAWGAKSEHGGSGTFRVEEYKKPEFEVTVTADAHPRSAAAPGAEDKPALARVGDVITAKIAARYYFGAPVPKARVNYTVTGVEWIPESPFVEPYSHLYTSPSSDPDEGRDDPDWEPIEMRLISGTAITNAAGEAAVRIDTAMKNPRQKGRHLKFTIHAEVTDASRRTIEGTGEVRALATQFNAFVNVRRGYYVVGDRLQADVRTLTADGLPTGVRGIVRVLRLTRKEDRIESSESHREPLATDETGRAVFTWSPLRDGWYEIRFESRDPWEEQVTGRDRAWVAGDGTLTGVFHNRHALLIPERSTYRSGDTAKVLLVTDSTNTTALLTWEAGGRLLEKRVVRATARSQVLEIPITRRDEPDVVLAVSGVRDRTFFRNETRLYVPPARRLLTVEVRPDQERYKPGEKASFRLVVRDADGKGVRTEASVGVVDRSLFYIQGDTTPAMDAFFYAGERGSGLQAQESLSQTLDTAREDDQPAPKFKVRAWEYPRGLGRFAALGDGGSRRSIHGDDLVLHYASTGLRSNGEMSNRWMGMGGAGAPGTFGAFSAPAGLVSRDGRSLQNTLTLRTLRLNSLSPPAPKVRNAFADTAFWTPAVVTDANGEATVEVTWPDNLTEWRATTRAWSGTAQVGEATADVETHKELLVRLQAPRFFMERDELVLSANVHNYTGREQKVRVTLELYGDALVAASTPPPGAPGPRAVHLPRADTGGGGASFAAPGPERGTGPAQPMIEWATIPQGAERRVDWRVRVERAGDVKVRVLAEAADESDAVEMSFPVLTHGIEKLVVKSGTMLAARGEKPGTRTAKLTIDLPSERAPDSGELIVQVSPSVAATMLDALPYLVDYPYGCVEQTMSRFFPSVLCARTLTDLGLDLSVLKKRAALEWERAKALKPGDRIQTSAYTYPEGVPGRLDAERMAREMWDWRANKSPVYNRQILKKMTADGLARLSKFQRPDGGWGWWEADRSDPHMTAYVLQGLTAARAAGTAVRPSMLARGFASLDASFKKESGLHDLAYHGWVLTLDPARAPAVGSVLLTRVYPKRERLTAYSLALLALALQGSGHPAAARVCMENLENTAKIDQADGTCSWTRDDGYWWGWHNNDVETATACLRVFNRLDPKHRLAPMVVRWLCNNRAGGSWSTTRETALAIQALAEYARANRELAPDYTVTVDVGGRHRRSFKVNAANALLFDNRLVVPARALGSGTQTITVSRQGEGTVYYSAYLRYFTLEEGIRATGNQLRVRRRYYRLSKTAPAAPSTAATRRPKDGYFRSLVGSGEMLNSGDLLEVELILESKNNYEHLVFEDMKPAGCEPVDLRSGSRYGDGLCSNMELRDQKVAFFVTHMPQGKRRITYRIRAEVPGVFHALPLNGYAMYAPAVRCLSDEATLGIVESQDSDTVLGAGSSDGRKGGTR